jgi:hypothetical protein
LFRAKLGAMTTTSARRVVLVALLLSAFVSIAASSRHVLEAPTRQDPLGAEIAHWRDFLASNAGSDESWDDVRQGSRPLLLHAETALRDGRRLLALNRLAAAREGLAAARYLYSLDPRQRQDPTRFEAEWRRVGDVLRQELAPPAANAFDGVGPAAVRAIGESALPQVRVYYEASLDYGRSTVPDAGLYYIGAALAQRELASLVRSLAASASPPAPPLRPLEPELNALEAEILSAYRPPASIDRHADFIRASAALKEARELDALGLRYGALLRYLQAVQRTEPIRNVLSASWDAGQAAALEKRLREYSERLASPDRDHSLGRLFLETAQALAGPGQDADPAAAQAIVGCILPRYFAALEPAPPAAPQPKARVTVTLVRWPYT